jgi:BirA family biotin operon repressor/biotin-[acetyl-CoA-carboxylase] ligase
MDFPLSSELVNRLDYVASTGSTNTDLIAHASGLEDLSVLVAGYQSAGRGRSTGRQWLAPEGSSLAISILLRPSASDLSPTSFGWLPLLAGLAMARAVGQFIPASEVAVKWPNDVLVNEHKIAGILSELLPDLSGVVIGAGINIRQKQDELPIETATSLALERNKLGETSELSNDKILAAYLGEIRALYSRGRGRALRFYRPPCSCNHARRSRGHRKRGWVRRDRSHSDSTRWRSRTVRRFGRRHRSSATQLNP